MGTKLTELRDGCFHAAMDDEPMFVLLARDPNAPLIVQVWADNREREISEGRRPASDMGKVREARKTAKEMREWRRDHDGEWRTGLFAVDAVKDIVERAGFTFDEESAKAVRDACDEILRGPIGQPR